MARLMLSDELWSKLGIIMRQQGIYDKPDLRLIEFDLTGGEVHDSKAVPELIARLPLSDYIIADKGYDSEDSNVNSP